MAKAKSARKVQREEPPARPVVGTYAVEATQFPPLTFMPLHEDIASGTLGDDTFVVSRSVTSLHMFLTVTPQNGEVRREEIDIADLIKKWVQKESISLRHILSPETRELAQALLDTIDASGNFDAHSGAERMACILLGDNWNGKLD